jgi:hypothetical protein
VISILDYDLLDNVFQPLKYIDLAQIYLEYASIVDFFIYLVFFLGLARVAFEKHFKGVGGKFIVVSVGVALSLAMVYAEDSMGFRLSRLGGLAILIFIFILSVMVYMIFKGIGISSGLAAAVIFFYLALNALSPAFYNKLTQSLPLLNLLFLLALILAFYNLFKGVLPRFSGKNNRLVSDFLKDNRILKKGMEKLTVKARKDAIGVSKGLDEVNDGLKESHSRHDMMTASGQIEKLRAKARTGELKEILDRIRALDYKLKTLDVDAVRELQKKHDEVPEEEKKRIREAIEVERKKLKLEDQIKAFEEMCFRHVKDFDECLKEAESAVERMDKAGAEKWLSDATEHNRNIRALLHEMEAVEETLIQLNKKELKSFG